MDKESLWTLTFCFSLFSDKLFKGAGSNPFCVLPVKARRGEYSKGPGGTQWMQMIYGVAALSISNYFYHHLVASIDGYELKYIA